MKTAPKCLLSEKRESQSDEKTVKGEPGVGSNRPPQAQANASAAPGSSAGKKSKETLEESTNIPSITNIERRTEGLFPKNVTVAISIPKDYYEKVARADGHEKGTNEDSKKKYQTEVNLIREGIEQGIKTQVARLIPASPTNDNVVGNSYYREPPPPPPTSTASYLAMASDWFNNWAGTIGLGLLALFALRMLGKGMPPAAGQMAAITAREAEMNGAFEEEEGTVTQEKLAAAAPTVI